MSCPAVLKLSENFDRKSANQSNTSPNTMAFRVLTCARYFAKFNVTDTSDESCKGSSIFYNCSPEKRMFFKFDVKRETKR